MLLAVVLSAARRHHVRLIPTDEQAPVFALARREIRGPRSSSL